MNHEKPKAKKVSDLLVQEFPALSSYIYPEILPKGGTLLFGGEAKIGKSWLMTEFARSLVTTKNPFDYEGFYIPSAVDVLVLEQELGPRGLKERLKKVFEKEEGDWTERLWYESKKPELQLDRAEGRKYVVDMLRDVKPNVLILDPISMMHGYNENAADEIAKLFRHLEEFKKVNPEKEMAVILSHHFGKPMRGVDGRIAQEFDRLSQYNFRGTSKWKDTPDTICTAYRGVQLKTPWESWELHARWITRHGSSPPDMTFSVCERNDDGRVRWLRNKGGGAKIPLLVEGPYKEVKVPDKREVDRLQNKFNFTPV